MADKSDSYFDADLPIKGKKSDRLGRQNFAASIARQILDVPVEHGFTVAVTGEWGSGKTSVLNMVAESLGEMDGSVAVLSFNPWLFGGSTELVSRFFGELSAQLGKGNSGQLKVVARVLTDMGKALAQYSSIPGASPAAAMAGVAVNKWTETPSLLSQRERLRESLETLKSRIVVIVDDIDRLERQETRELIRLIRLTSNLPHLVFLLAFDRRHVVRCFGESEQEGQLYLDKIVQVNYTLPAVREAVLSNEVLSQLEGVVQGRQVVWLDDRVWNPIFYDVIKPLLSNFRDIKRYLYSLPVTLDLIGEEVALADLLGLEAVRVLRPTLFDEIKAHPDCLVFPRSDYRVSIGNRERLVELENELSGMLERASTDRKTLESVFALLFPITQEFLKQEHIRYDDGRYSTWRKERRVACEEVFQIYLTAGLDDGALSTGDIRDIVELLSDESKFSAFLDGLDARGMEEVLERLQDFDEHFPDECVPIAVPIIVNRIDGLSKDKPGFLGISPRAKAIRTVDLFLRRIEHQDTIQSLVPKAIDKLELLSGKLLIVELVGHRGHVGNKLVTEELAEQLESRLVETLISMSLEDLTKEWDLIGLALRPVNWLEDERKEQLSNRLIELLKEEEFVLALLHSGAYDAYFLSSDNPPKYLPWESLMETFGDGLPETIIGMADPQVAKDLAQDDLDMISLAQEFISGQKSEDLI